MRASVHAHPLKASAAEPELFAPEELLEPKQDRHSAFENSPQSSHPDSDPGTFSMNGPSSSGQAGHKWFANWFGKDHEATHDSSMESPLRQPPFVSLLPASVLVIFNCTQDPGKRLGAGGSDSHGQHCLLSA